MCHGAVANENGDWYKWALYCSVGEGQDLGLLSNFAQDDQADASGDFCDAIMATGAHERAGDYRLVSGEGQTAIAAAFGDGFCVEYAALLEAIGNELNVFA